MDFIWFIIVGLVAGTLAKLLVPGSKSEPQGWFLTILLGMAGALLFGFAANLVLGWNVNGNLLGTILSATIGSALLILILRAVKR
ncbi:GlsB/YeaQ/YmgE family stress response membrane protein [Fimbriimonadia bacterium ATM]|nr:MAG: GlsB/YeaQ/YmgE family stress response membrane protein [Armatimonadota bacterium]MBC6970888.1 GlsB/YeaQ/YmgE family stress response membrane protein [Armatimonadota bacterium]MCE7899712.1 GlsB/YeaQ/YmgE family stress response membrane protein [Armatimonadetes bacterium ATM1]MDL1927797.1 GlsB/YeaQ/YmgE family stress response membrane protein [Fimbriimonadia bacterium ATM]RIJ95299.1 MAG: GlsB/YeaQ/YmgE family stress response membrane protein [Armatimonadota bacterium]